MTNVHLVIPDLFLPQQVSTEVCSGLALPALEKLLARAQSAPLAEESLEAWLCSAFGVADQAIAPITLRADGQDPGPYYWLRADPVHLSLQRDQLILQTGGELTTDEATQLCARLNAHFVDDGLIFFAPHPQRWYLQLNAAPTISTRPLAQVVGRNCNAHLPQGADALRWHGIFNEIQMLLFDHVLNQEREARGELPINSVWLWGGGYATGQLARPYTRVYGDSNLASSFAHTAGIPGHFFSDADLSNNATKGVADDEGDVLIVWEGLSRALRHGDLHAWRDKLQRFEQIFAEPLLNEIRAGRIARLTLDIPQAGGARRFVLTRGSAWKFWMRPKPLARYAV